jgi:hypothetical protein
MKVNRFTLFCGAGLSFAFGIIGKFVDHAPIEQWNGKFETGFILLYLALALNNEKLG